MERNINNSTPSAQFFASPRALRSRNFYGVSSWPLYRQNLKLFFPEQTLYSPLSTRLYSQLTGILVWGNKPSGLSANKLATKLSIPLLRVEDGFLYGLEPSSTRMSLVIDDLGIYYDARHPSRVEYLINYTLRKDQVNHARTVRDLWIHHEISKYNHAPDWDHDKGKWHANSFILVIDQTRGDQSIKGALADESSFFWMLESALSRTDIEHIVIKAHPEVVRGHKLGHFDLSPDSAILRNPRIHVLTNDYSLASVIKDAAAVYTVSSQAGFESLLWGKPTYTFGVPFYAGWGLTVDHIKRPSRRKNITIEQLIHAALIEYPRYLHPESKQLCSPEDLIHYLGFQRQQRNRLHRPVHPMGLSWNKRKNFKRFTQGCTSPTSEDLALGNYYCALWGNNKKPDFLQDQIEPQYLRIEDGFIRSLGLGAAFSKPYSWVFDKSGIYYDATCPSDLEKILENNSFDNDTLQRAQNLRNQLIERGISKYNIPSSKKGLKALAILENHYKNSTHRKILLVIGQVESDSSIKYGGIDIKTNLQLLTQVRIDNPDAIIIYKPHPDIEKNLRFSGKLLRESSSLYDELITNVDLAECLEFVDEVHTITSLAGFEALIRGKKVVCYGMPFYAGWGLTFDRHTCTRRTKKLSLNELVAGALIQYPTYVHPRTQLYCTPESLIEELSQIQKKELHGISKFIVRFFDFLKLKGVGLINSINGA